LRASTAAGGADDLGTLDQHTYGKNRLADDRRMRRGSRSAAEVHADIAVPVIVPTVTETVCRISAQRYDQRECRDERY